MTSNVITERVLPRSRVTDIVLVVAGAALTAVAAQWVIPLEFTPVPITGQTFAVLLTGASLGMKRGAASQLVYVLVGAIGAPIYADGAGGLDVILGSTGGYLIGFVWAAALVGRMAEHRHDRTFATMFTAFILGSGVIYLFGVAGLMLTLRSSLTEAVAIGVVPFVFGDVVKAVAAGLLLPGAWRLLGER